ncbi:MAG: ATP-dependent helicase, partial [Rubrimonas sp.]
DGDTPLLNFDQTDYTESYTHRIGRTARNGADGVAITLCDETETDKLRAVEKLIRRAFLPDGTLGDQPPAPAPRQQKAGGKPKSVGAPGAGRRSRGRGSRPRQAA